VCKLIGNFLCLHKVAGECKSQRRTRSHVHITRACFKNRFGLTSGTYA
jgi:hypothetical protein